LRCRDCSWVNSDVLKSCLRFSLFFFLDEKVKAEAGWWLRVPSNARVSTACSNKMPKAFNDLPAFQATAIQKTVPIFFPIRK
jgi:hypothetical protein